MAEPKSKNNDKKHERHQFPPRDQWDLQDDDADTEYPAGWEDIDEAEDFEADDRDERRR